MNGGDPHSSRQAIVHLWVWSVHRFASASATPPSTVAVRVHASPCLMQASMHAAALGTLDAGSTLPTVAGAAAESTAGEPVGVGIDPLASPRLHPSRGKTSITVTAKRRRSISRPYHMAQAPSRRGADPGSRGTVPRLRPAGRSPVVARGRARESGSAAKAALAAGRRLSCRRTGECLAPVLVVPPRGCPRVWSCETSTRLGHRTPSGSRGPARAMSNCPLASNCSTGGGAWGREDCAAGAEQLAQAATISAVRAWLLISAGAPTLRQ